MILVFRETDGKTGDRLTIGEAAVPDGSTLVRSGRYIVGMPGGAPHAAVTVTDGAAIDLQIGGGSGQVLTADLLYDPNYFAIDGTNHLTASGTLLTHDLLSVTHHGDTIPASVVRGDLVTGQGAAPNTFWQRLGLGGAATYLRSDGTDSAWSGIQAGDLPNLGTAGVHAKFAATGLADSILTEAAGGIEMPTAKYFGLGAAKGRLTFEDAATDFICFMDCSVGIGTTNPDSLLDVHGTITLGSSGVLSLIPDVNVNGAARTLRFNYSSSSLSEGFQFYNSDSSTNLVFIQGDGKVGINTTTPAALVDIKDGLLYFTDSDCAHGVTTYLPTDVYGSIHAASATDGGLDILGTSDTDNYGLSLQGMVGDNTPTYAPMRLVAMKKNGTGAADMGYDELAYSFTNRGRQVVSIYGDGNLNLYNEAVDATGDVLTFWKERNGFTDIVGGDVVGTIDFQGMLSSSYTSIAKIEAKYYGLNGGNPALSFYTNGTLAGYFKDHATGFYCTSQIVAASYLVAPKLMVDHITEKTYSHGIVFDHNMSSANKNLSSGTADIADDNFTSFTPGRTHGIMLMSCQNTSIGIVVGYEVGATPSITIIAQNGTSFEVTTGALNGTTGSDAHFTLSTHTDGKIYLENRLGGT